jgi:2'-5' RNA ligase
VIRAFVAVGLDEETRTAIGAAIEQLRPLGKAVAWVPAENLHLTLKFLGEQTDERLAEATRGIEDAAAATPRFTVSLHGLGGFPGMERPRIVWIGAAEALRFARQSQWKRRLTSGFDREAALAST